MKFTEEQFNKLVEIQEDQYRGDLFGNSKTFVGSISRTVAKTEANLRIFIEQNYLGNEAVALMNPLTREWAHEQFVEKEKRYVWTSKKPYYQGLYKRLYMATGGYVGYKTLEANELEVGEDEYVTETEVRKNGYDPDWFDKEEVK